jgi:hypothetical protein
MGNFVAAVLSLPVEKPVWPSTTVARGLGCVDVACRQVASQSAVSRAPVALHDVSSIGPRWYRVRNGHVSRPAQELCPGAVAPMQRQHVGAGTHEVSLETSLLFGLPKARRTVRDSRGRNAPSFATRSRLANFLDVDCNHVLHGNWGVGALFRRGEYRVM